MDRNASIVRSVQEKIDGIVADAPKLFTRLDVVMAPRAVAALLCDHEPVLRMLRPLRYNLPGPFSAPILGGVVSDRAVSAKQAELDQLTAEVVMLFERIRVVLTRDAMVDICCATGRIVVPPEGHHESLRILEVYYGHLDTLHEQQLREEILRELDSSPSSNDSCWSWCPPQLV